jgi:alcohol dehydrogenase (cytochrome c)
MRRITLRLKLAVLLPAMSLAAQAQTIALTAVSADDLLNPPAADWLMYSRTYDNQRYSPLEHINRDNVANMTLVWSRDMHAGTQENIPLVHQGVMFIANPQAIIQAIDAANGELLWEYQRDLPDDLGQYIRAIGRARTLALYDDMVYYAAPDGFLVALDMRNGKLRWETFVHDYKSSTQHTTGPMVVKGNVLTGRNCGDTRKYCFIAAHDAKTGKEIWKFHVTAAPGEPGGDTWGAMATDLRIASPWGLPGAYDPDKNLVYWGTANPNPHTRIKRHDGKPFSVPLTAPSELYSNSTLALNPDTGELAWYYQHLPGDDWDSDHTHERILFRSTFDPDPAAVKWINPNIARGEQRDMVVSVGEPGGLWVLDRTTGEFLWTIPFPFDSPDFHIADIDVETGITSISRDKILTAEGEQHTTCFQNTKSYWPMAYHPVKNALYVPYHDACVTRTGRLDVANGHTRTSHAREGSDPDAFTGLARVDMRTGAVTQLHTQRNPGNGAVLLTAGDIVFWGDVTGTLYAIDAEAGEILWDASVKGIIQTSTITYAVDGRQYVAILTGDGLSGTSGPLAIVNEVKTDRGHNAVYVFALPKETE